MCGDLQKDLHSSILDFLGCHTTPIGVTLNSVTMRPRPGRVETCAIFPFLSLPKGRLPIMHSKSADSSVVWDYIAVYAPGAQWQDALPKPVYSNNPVRDAISGAKESIQRSRIYWQTHETNKTAMKLYDAVAKKDRVCRLPTLAVTLWPEMLEMPSDRSFASFAQRLSAACWQ